MVDIADSYDLYIDGERVPAADGSELTTYDPATDEGKYAVEGVSYDF